jgi:hypothetical protein
MTSFVPLTYEHHREVRIGPEGGLTEFSNLSLLPIYDLEIPKLAGSFPLAFAPESPLPFAQDTDDYRFCLLCSLSDGMPNGWINHEGKWVGKYLPAVIRQRPFTVLMNENEELVLCIDEDSPLIMGEGEPLFEDGSPTEFLTRVKQYLPALYNSGVRTSNIIKLLQELDLFTPWEIQFFNEEEVATTVQGVFRINEEKLKQLNDEDWLSLKNAGAMPLIYGQLMSTGNLQTLAFNLQSKINYTKDLEIPQESIDFALGGDNDTLDFDKP